MNRALVVLLVLALAGPACAGSGIAARKMQASAVLWRPEVRGSLGASLGDLQAGASYEDSETALGYQLAFRPFGAVCLDLSYTPISADATVQSSASLRFRNVQFGAFGTGHVRYEMPILEGGLRYLALDGRWLRLGVIGSVKVLQPDVTLTAAGKTAQFDAVFPVPMAGLSAQVNVTPWAHLFGSFKLLHLELSSVVARVDDWEVGAVVDWSNFPKHHGMRFGAGYRRLDIELAVDEDDLRFATRRGGPYAEVAFVW